MRAKEIKALLIEPMKHPKVCYIKATVKTLRQIVNADDIEFGGIEAKKLEHGIFAVFNKDRFLVNLVPNRQINGDIISGTILILAVDDKYQPTSLSNEQVSKYALRFWNKETFDDMDVVEANLDLMFSRLIKDE
ncbi:MAG: DUF3846 domain-containing protein [Clostridia bacterium]|nr:DUF3846 domain-containing protein [Clostridia bacterium]